MGTSGERTTIAFPGNLQGRHIRETGPRGALMVTAEGADIQSVERLHVDVLRWHALEVDVSIATNLDEAVRLAGRALEALLGGSETDLPLAVRVTLQGASPAHGNLSSDAAASLARAGLPPAALTKLADRAMGGESRAQALVAEALAHLGADAKSYSERERASSSHEMKNFEGSPADYPPERYEELRDAMSGMYGQRD